MSSFVRRTAYPCLILLLMAACAPRPVQLRQPSLPQRTSLELIAPVLTPDERDALPARDAIPPEIAASTPPANGEAEAATPVSEQDIREAEAGEQGEGGPAVAVTTAAPVPPAPRNLGGNGRLTITRHDTGERVSVTYRDRDGAYDPRALEQINRIMRCSLDDSEIDIPPLLAELLDAVEDKFGKKGIVLLSGYRTLELNRTIRGAADQSMHMLGWAADIRVPGYGSQKVKTFARKLKSGGVGYYPQMGFTHVDIGKPRYWEVRKRKARKKSAAKGATKRGGAAAKPPHPAAGKAAARKPAAPKPSPKKTASKRNGRSR